MSWRSNQAGHFRTRQTAADVYSAAVNAATLRFFSLFFLMFARGALGDARLTLLTNFSDFTRIETNAWVSPAYAVAKPFEELVVSWNVPTNVACQIDTQVRCDGQWGRWWTFARWFSEPNTGARTSVSDQRDATGRMDTDTLKLKSEADAIRVRIRFDDANLTPRSIRLLGLSLWSESGNVPAEAPKTARVIDVPAKSQAEYPEGINQWCSPTCTAMLLAHWGRVLRRPDLDFDVPVVARGVFDPGWAGTGNWPFNTAFAGGRPGIRASVARLNGVQDVAALVEAGMPVTVSVSYSMLKGASRRRDDDGHLVVVCGFKPGVVVINDPGVRLDRVRREFPLDDFVRSWGASHHTAYLVWPETMALPPSPAGTW